VEGITLDALFVGQPATEGLDRSDLAVDGRGREYPLAPLRWSCLVIDNPLPEELRVSLNWGRGMTFLKEPGDKGGEGVVMPADRLNRSSLCLVGIEIQRDQIFGVHDDSYHEKRGECSKPGNRRNLAPGLGFIRGLYKADALSPELLGHCLRKNRGQSLPDPAPISRECSHQRGDFPQSVHRPAAVDVERLP
jgi:hypothetical protein